MQVQIIQVTPFQQNCALIWDDTTKKAAVIDPGGDVPAIQAAIASAGVMVENIYLTHGHLDHAGGAAALARTLAVPVIGPDARDQFLLDGMEAQAKQFGLPDVQAVTPTRWLSEGETVDIAGQNFAVLHCPGHTPGHVVFVNRAQNFGIFGDVLFNGSVGRTDFPYGDTAALISAITTKLMVLPDEFTFICGHGPASTIGAERASNLFLE